MLAFIASRLLGLLRELVISYQFGTSRSLDAYQAAFRVPDLIFQIVAAGAMGAAFIPPFTAYLARRHEHDAWRMASTVITVTFLVMAICSALAAVFAPQIVPLIAPGFDAPARELTVTLMRIMLIQAVVASISGLVTAILNSYKDFLLPALAPVVYNATIIVAALTLAGRPELGVKGLAIGVALGSLFHLLIQVPGLAYRKVKLRPRIDLSQDGAREVFRLMLPRIAGLGAIQINFLANTIIASRLIVGSIAALNYAFQLLMLPWGIFANAISTAIFPSLAEEAALDRQEQIAHMLSGALRIIMYLTIPAAVGLFVLADPLVRLLFQRGQFTALSTAMTASALRFYCPGLVAIAATEIVTRGFYSLHDTRSPVVVGVLTVTLNILLSIVLSGFMSFSGLALAYSIANSVEAVVLLSIIRDRVGGVDEGRLLRSLGRVVVAAAIMGEGLALGAYALGDILVTGSFMVRLFLLSVLVLAGAALYILLTIWLGSEEVTRLRRARP